MFKQELKKNHFGLHLTLDCYGCDSKILNNRPELAVFLDEAVKHLGMRRLCRPTVVRAPGSNKKDPGGWSGFVIIQESHISVHTFPKRKFVSIDVYSCRDFREQVITNFVKKFFRAASMEKNIIVRGKRYPMNNFS